MLSALHGLLTASNSSSGSTAAAWSCHLGPFVRSLLSFQSSPSEGKEKEAKEEKVEREGKQSDTKEAAVVAALLSREKVTAALREALGMLCWICRDL